jgi:hypothetical protein
MKFLLEKKMYMCGAMCLDRKDWPSEYNNSKALKTVMCSHVNYDIKVSPQPFSILQIEI